MGVNSLSRLVALSAVMCVIGALIGCWIARIAIDESEAVVVRSIGDLLQQNASLQQQLGGLELLIKGEGRTSAPAERGNEVSVRPDRQLDQDSSGASEVKGLSGIDEIMARLESIERLVQASSASIVDIALEQPGPNEAALSNLRAKVEVENELLLRVTQGMSHRDAIIAFGTPTKRRDPPDTFSAGLPVTEWLWDMPKSDCVLLVTFSGGVARWATFTRRDRLDER
jgi:hypothetical protein